MKKYDFFTPTEIAPTGWLKRQLEIQADGLSGNLDKVWPDIRDSRWIGGTCDGWERVPYWLDGFIPLAFLLHDTDKIERAKRYVDAIVAGQREDGWLCPCEDSERAGYDMWALYLIDKVLMLYYSCSGDERIPDVVYRSLRNLNAHIDEHPIFGWAHSRWFECLIPIYHLYGICGEDWLLELGKKLRAQGMKYEENYAGGDEWQFRDARPEWRQDTHVVNQAMAIKEGALSSLLDLPETEAADDSFCEYMLGLLFKYHGTAVGHFTGDECIAGDSPIHGTELCGVVEAMYSYEVLYSLTGNPVWADRLEKLTYNALPATVTPDMWAHQYDQMVNQPACVKMDPDHTIFYTNSGESHLFGLEPNFGCCTANFNQGFPKFALSVFMKAPDGIAVCAVAPSKVETKIDGTIVKIESETLYPFGSDVNYIVSVEDECEFTLTLRIPSCAASARLDGESVEPGTVVTLRRTWTGVSVVRLEMEFDVKYVSRPRNMFVLERGPLVYSLELGNTATKLEYTRNNVERKYPYCDWEFRPTTPWEYAFAGGDIAVHETESVSDIPFSPDAAPVYLDVPVYPIDWRFKEGYNMVPNETPASTAPTGERRTVRFIPYGSTNIRMTELPKLD